MGFRSPPQAHSDWSGWGAAPPVLSTSSFFLHPATETKAVHLPHPGIAAAKDIYGKENSSDKGL